VTTVAFIQARLGSTRLPGKVLEDLEGKPVLMRIVERVRGVHAVDGAVVLVPMTDRDAPLRSFCDAAGIDCFAGDEHDVLARFAAALAVYPCDRLVRITADCPLVDPSVLDDLLTLHRNAGVDYAAVATGAIPPSPNLRRFPDGLDAEAVDVCALRIAADEAVDPFEREHVTPFIWRRPERFTHALLEASTDLGDERWTIDHPEDLELVRRIYAALGADRAFGYADVIALLEAEPELRLLNASLRAHRA
jgi:spore coat polysaccharide biosynthesis protein SpsF